MWSLWGEKLSSCLSTLSCNHGLDTSLLPFNLATQTPGEDLLNPVLLSFKLKGNYTECDYTLASHFVKYTSTKLDPPLTSWWKHLTCGLPILTWWHQKGAAHWFAAHLRCKLLVQTHPKGALLDWALRTPFEYSELVTFTKPVRDDFGCVTQ